MDINRYKEVSMLYSSLNPLEDVFSWIEGLTSVNYVKDLLKSKHTLTSNLNVSQCSKSITKLVSIACKYFEQANKGPEEVSFLPLYYGCLNLLKSYIIISPYAADLSTQPYHGASYEQRRDFTSLDDEVIKLQRQGTIPLFYRTVTGEDMFQHTDPPLKLKMSAVYPYITDISAEYKMATGKKEKLIPFYIYIQEKGEKHRIRAQREVGKLPNIKLNTLQAFKRLRRETKGSNTFVSKWYTRGDTESPMTCIRPALLYSRGLSSDGKSYSCVPSSDGTLLLPEELPLICAFYHMSSVVRYNPEGLYKLMDSKYWPLVLVLRRHGLYRLLLLFWSFINQCCTHITTE